MNEITFQPGSAYLHAYVAGESDSYDMALRTWQEILGELVQRKMKRVVVHENIRGELSDLDTYNLANELRKIVFSGIKIAILDRDPEHCKSTEFGVLVGTNRGLQVRSFDTAIDAERWLLASIK